MTTDAEYDFNEKEEVLGLEIEDSLSIEDTEEMLVKLNNYGDYLATQRKAQRLEARSRKELFKHWRLVYLKQSTLGDAKAREAEADNLAKVFLKDFDVAEIEADYIKDLLSNNHDKVESLRSILSTKKTVWEKTFSVNQT